MEEAPWVTLFFLPTVHAVADHVEGFRVVPNGWWDLETCGSATDRLIPAT